MKLEINGKIYEINSQEQLDALVFQFASEPLGERFFSESHPFEVLNLLDKEKFLSYKNFVEKWCSF